MMFCYVYVLYIYVCVCVCMYICICICIYVCDFKNNTAVFQILDEKQKGGFSIRKPHDHLK